MLSAAHRREWWSRLISQTNANQESGRMMKRCSCLGHRQLLVQKGNGFNLPEYGYFHWLHSVLYYNGSWITICATYGVKNALLSIEEAPENQFVLVDMCIVKGYRECSGCMRPFQNTMQGFILYFSAYKSRLLLHGSLGWYKMTERCRQQHLVSVRCESTNRNFHMQYCLLTRQNDGCLCGSADASPQSKTTSPP